MGAAHEYLLHAPLERGDPRTAFEAYRRLRGSPDSLSVAWVADAPPAVEVRSLDDGERCWRPRGGRASCTSTPAAFQASSDPVVGLTPGSTRDEVRAVLRASGWMPRPQAPTLGRAEIWRGAVEQLPAILAWLPSAETGRLAHAVIVIPADHEVQARTLLALTSERALLTLERAPVSPMHTFVPGVDSLPEHDLAIVPRDATFGYRLGRSAGGLWALSPPGTTGNPSATWFVIGAIGEGLAPRHFSHVATRVLDMLWRRGPGQGPAAVDPLVRATMGALGAGD